MAIIHRRDTPIIHAYSRAQALADEALIDVTPLAREAGFTYPVALTRAVWVGCVRWDSRRDGALQDETGRLWDVLWPAAAAARHGLGRALGASSARYTLQRIPQGDVDPQPVQLVLTAGPGDGGEPVLTIHEPDED